MVDLARLRSTPPPRKNDGTFTSTAGTIQDRSASSEPESAPGVAPLEHPRSSAGQGTGQKQEEHADDSQQRQHWAQPVQQRGQHGVSHGDECGPNVRRFPLIGAGRAEPVQLRELNARTRVASPPKGVASVAITTFLHWRFDDWTHAIVMLR